MGVENMRVVGILTGIVGFADAIEELKWIFVRSWTFSVEHLSFCLLCPKGWSDCVKMSCKITQVWNNKIYLVTKQFKKKNSNHSKILFLLPSSDSDKTKNKLTKKELHRTNKWLLQQNCQVNVTQFPQLMLLLTVD